MVCVSASFVFAEEDERKLVVKPVLTSRADVETDWGGLAEKAAADPRYELTKVEGADNLYKTTIALKKYFISNKWKSSLGTTYPAEYPKEGWEETHQFVVVYQDEYGDQENKSNPNAVAGAQAFLVPEENTEITFYAIVNPDNGTIRSYCDARSAQLTIQNNEGGNAIFPAAIGKTSSVVAVDIANSANKKIELQIDANITHPTGLAGGSKLAIYERGRHAFVLDFLTMQYKYYKVLDALVSPKVKVGDAAFIGAAALPADLGQVTANFRLGASIDGISNTSTTFNAGDVQATFNYEIIPAGETEGTIVSVPLTTTVTGARISATWSAADIKIAEGLDEGTYTLKVWYETDSHGDVLVDDNANGLAYTTAFEVVADDLTSIVPVAFDATSVGKLYSLTGVLVQKNVTNRSALNVVPGIYILSVNGENKKIIVK
ncbi:hypothetical protein FACS189413_06130 [Bacteroidia bacterium]|nr:hypothetical protein FACS189413_06130 [Bacteroidia bacterium]